MTNEPGDERSDSGADRRSRPPLRPVRRCRLLPHDEGTESGRPVPRLPGPRQKHRVAAGASRRRRGNDRPEPIHVRAPGSSLQQALTQDDPRVGSSPPHALAGRRGASSYRPELPTGERETAEDRSPAAPWTVRPVVPSTRRSTRVGPSVRLDMIATWPPPGVTTLRSRGECQVRRGITGAPCCADCLSRVLCRGRYMRRVEDGRGLTPGVANCVRSNPLPEGPSSARCPPASRRCGPSARACASR
jgi:hypothetical protein